MTHECMICGVRVEVLFDPVGCAAWNREKGKNRRDRMCGFGSPLKREGTRVFFFGNGELNDVLNQRKFQ